MYIFIINGGIVMHGLFGYKHIIILVVCVIAMIIGYFICRNKKLEKPLICNGNEVPYIFKGFFFEFFL